jgi:hypothetical protein
MEPAKMERALLLISSKSCSASMAGRAVRTPLWQVAEMLDATVGWDGGTNTVTVTAKGQQAVAAKTHDAILHFPVDRYPETATHIQAAIAKGESAICTIDRACGSA